MHDLPATARIAVIGAGISGLTAAHYLSRRHAVTLFEADDYVGGHTCTVEVALDGQKYAVDAGFIVFNDRTYPNFVALLNELGVRSRETSMGFSLRCDRTGLEYQGSSLNGLFAQRRNLLRIGFYRMLRDILRFNRESVRLVLEGEWGRCNDETTVAEFLNYRRYSREFVEHYLFPLGSAIWSCPAGSFAQFPIRFLVEFYRNHGMLSLRDRPQWRVIEGGSRTYVEAVLRRFSGRVFCGSPIAEVRRFSDRVEIRPAGGSPCSFDHVVIACHADQALKMLADPTPAEKKILSSFPYQKNLAILHTDESLLPRRRRAWASWNYRLPRPKEPVRRKRTIDRRWSFDPSDLKLQDGAPHNDGLPGATVTYCMNILQHIRSPHVFNVTLNSADHIDPSKILRQFQFEHPVFTPRRAAAQRRRHEMLGTNRTSYCGAYWGYGFHEDGVVSALEVCRKLEGSSQAAAARESFRDPPRSGDELSSIKTDLGEECPC